jgi:isoleucyl-tRNA synthetase
VAVDAVLTPDLKAEGLAREIVRRIQAMRKDAGFDIADRIVTTWQTDGELAGVFIAWADYIRSETLTVALNPAEPSDGAYSEKHNIDGLTLTLSVRKA